MSLFNKLLGFAGGSIQLEDFFTEIVARLFEHHPEVFFKWIGWTGELYRNKPIRTYTQRFCPALKGDENEHDGNDRDKRSFIDLVVELNEGKEREVIFIESKVGSHEGPGQLPRYAKILADESARKRLLLYVTRDYDRKEESEILKDGVSSKVKFSQRRWYELYRCLKGCESDFLVAETLTFMEEHGMALDNRFSPVDLLTMTNFPRVLSMMEETMWGQVEEEFKEVIGGVNKQAASMTQIRYHNRYVMYTDKSTHVNGVLGFHFALGNDDPYPKVVVQLEAHPQLRQVIEMMEKYREENKHWHFEKYRSGYAKLRTAQSLRAFLDKEDHVKAIREFFLERLNEIAKLKDKHKGLPWFG